MGIGVKMRKGVIFSVKRCYRAISNHLLLVCFLFILAFLYRSCPLIFLMLVSASPVLVCTLVLLGALLSFGKPSMPNVDLDHCETHEVVILKAGFSDDNNVDRKGSEFVEKCSGKGTNMEEKLTERVSEIVNDISKGGLDGSYGKKVEKISREKEFDDRVQEVGKKRYQGFKSKNKRKTLEEKISGRRNEDTQYSLLAADDTDDEGGFAQENKKLLVGSVDSNEANVDDLDYLGSPWKLVDKEEGYEDDDDEALDSVSGGAESSSPDASMTEPVLDELHPLLDEVASQPPNLSRVDSGASSERTISSSGSSSELDDDIDDPEELMVGEDGDEDGDGDDEEEINEEKEHQTESTITWTAEDQRNLMDLGTSELERNKRLENLIAKRRARRCMTTVTERNLIDLDIADPPINAPLIMTAKSNPFDPPLESYEITSLPPIPGSAPCTRLPWKNPFDIPFDLSDEKPNLMDGIFQQEFMPQHSKDPTFRRHESFNVHPSSFGMNRTENKEMEYMPQESKDPTFRRHESFNASFGMNRTEKQVINKFRPYFVSAQLGSEGTSYSPINRQPSEASGSKASSGHDTESFSSTEEEILIIDAEDDNVRELEVISEIDDASELVGHGSDSSSEEEEEEEEESLELGQVEKRDIKVDELDLKLEDVDNHQETGSSIKEERSIANQMQIGSSEILQNTEALDTTHKEPVYDSSPSEAFDPQVDSGVYLSAIVVKKSVSFSSRVTQIGSRGVNIDDIVDKVMLSNNSKSERTSVDESKTTPTGVDYITKHEITDDKGECESMARRDSKMVNPKDIECDSAGEKLKRSSINSNVPKNVPGNTTVIGKSSTENSVKENLINGPGASHKDHDGAFESPVSAEEADSFKDVGSESDESDMKDTIQSAPAETASEGKTPYYSDVGSPDISNRKEKSSKKRSSSSSSSTSSSSTSSRSSSCPLSGSVSYASLSDSHSD